MEELSGIPTLKEEEKVTIKKFTFGDKNKINSKCLGVNFSTQQPVLDIGKYRLAVVMYGIISAPFFTPGCNKEDVVENMEAELGEYLFKKIIALNKMDEDSTELKKK